jgi:hypothetical protein
MSANNADETRFFFSFDASLHDPSARIPRMATSKMNTARGRNLAAT